MAAVPSYFLSDVHLRYDFPDRADRLARFVEGLGPEDDLTIVGDLCDFWFASRQLDGSPLRCAGLAALASFRARGGSLTILAGNHDAWLGPFYESTLGARFVRDALEFERDGLRILAVHGHLLKAATPWKKLLNSRTFLGGFRLLPDLAANALDGLLNRTNRRNQAKFDRRGISAYREHVAGLRDLYDLVILGHVHLPVYEQSNRPMMVVLGGWQERGCHFRINKGECIHFVD
ncbi:UDP-2,3-diacylglucosamine diphosphatase [Tundrisphaera sp. TA3]|uniref:UDP-2,3-diacylglucosamine diphosphatase n=1 Tax=Tundrisphaera sp. TA3 TaxID=3435775 RepID=UPI003EB75293